MERLNWNTYKKLQNAMDQINHDYKFSALTLLSWTYYGIQIRFEIVCYFDFQIIFFDAKFNRFIDENEDGEKSRIASILKYGDHFILVPIFDETKISVHDAIYCSFYKLKKHYPIKTDWAIENVSNKQLNQLANLDYEMIYSWNSNFIYELENLKTFCGKKLQKKRNHLNYFKKNYLNQIQIQKITTNDFDELYDFLIYINNEKKINEGSFEHIVFRNVLDHFDFNTMSGTIIRQKSNNAIIAFTIGYEHKNTYEIFFEKADNTWRGLNQYLLAENLIINNINLKYMDRQDDVGNYNINFSKKSYYPIDIIQMHMIYIKVKNTYDLNFNFPLKNK